MNKLDCKWELSSPERPERPMIPVYGLQWEMIHLLRLYDSKLNSHHILTHKHLSMAASQLALLSPYEHNLLNHIWNKETHMFFAF